MKQSAFLRLMILCLLFPIFGMSLRNAAAQEGSEEMSFSDFIENLKEDGTIPDISGKIITFDSYEGSLANVGYWDAIPLLEADHFVISARFKMESGSTATFSMNAGCGFFFDAPSDGSEFMTVSARMDGNVYLQGVKNFSNLSYGNFYYDNPSADKEGKMTLVYNNNRVRFYVNDKSIMSRGDLPVMGNTVGLGVFSGAYYDFGTRCIFDEINVYTWE